MAGYPKLKNNGGFTNLQKNTEASFYIGKTKAVMRLRLKHGQCVTPQDMPKAM